LGEGDQAVELSLVAHLAPGGMIEILLAAALVVAGGLQMPARPGANPDVPPGGRHGEALNTPQGVRVGDRLTRRRRDVKAATAALSLNPCLVSVHVKQAGSPSSFRHVRRIVHEWLSSLVER